MKFRNAATIHVCALRHVPDMARRIGARHLVSAINADLVPETPTVISDGRHLKLNMNDIVEAQPDLIPPDREHVAKLVDFLQSWDQQAPILIHCYAGLSRSTAAAFISLCAMNPGVPEVTIARALRRSSDAAVPNRLFVALADKVLRREGRMITALNSMGENKIAYECMPFGVEALHDPNGSCDT